MPIGGKIQDRVSFWRKEPSEFLLNVHKSALLFCGIPKMLALQQSKGQGTISRTVENLLLVSAACFAFSK